MNGKIRILHILLNLHYGGVETFAINLWRTIDRRRFSFDFAVVEGPEGMNETEARKLGATIHRYRRPRNALSFLLDIDRLIRAGGPYDIVHSHLGLPSALALLAAHKNSVRARFAHAHSPLNLRSRLSFLYSRPLLATISHTATRKLAVSSRAATSYFGNNWTNDPLVDVLPCGIPLPLPPTKSKHELRRELDLPTDAAILISVGRMVPVKNHHFLIQVLRHLQPFQPTYLVLIGDGPLKGDLERAAREQGLEHKVIMPGKQTGPNVARYLHSADAFALPSLSEGLPMAAIEAQAAGLPCTFSTGIPKEASVLPELTTFLPLSEGPSRWAKQIATAVKGGKLELTRARSAIKESSFSIHSATRRLEALYEADSK